MSNLKISCLTDIGIRSVNEDRILTECYDGLYLLAIADGMGGHTAGEIASTIAIGEIQNAFRNGPLKNLSSEVICEVVEKTNRKMYQASKEQPQYSGMGTTLVMALVQKDKVLIANTGDSRAYRISGGHIERLTKDHSLVQALLERGAITEEEAWHHPLKGTLTKALGIKPEAETDIYDIRLLPGDFLLLCSDGLTDSLTDEEVNDVISSASNLDDACASLVRQAKEKGSTDNTSVILAREE